VERGNISRERVIWLQEGENLKKVGFLVFLPSLERGRKGPQKGGFWSKETGEKLGFRQKGGFLKSLERSMFGVKRTKGKRKRPQKGGFWGALERNMFGVKRTKGKKKRPQVTHNQKGGVLGLDKFSSYYNGKSKKDQQQMDTWAARNL
jgi:hypothetical protein